MLRLERVLFEVILTTDIQSNGDFCLNTLAWTPNIIDTIDRSLGPELMAEFKVSRLKISGTMNEAATSMNLFRHVGISWSYAF